MSHSPQIFSRSGRRVEAAIRRSSSRRSESHGHRRRGGRVGQSVIELPGINWRCFLDGPPDSRTQAKQVANPSNQVLSSCRGLRLDGDSCRSPIVDSSGFCFAHDPDRETERSTARSRGGINRRASIRLKRLAPEGLDGILELLEEALQDAYLGRIDSSTARAIAALVRAEVAVLHLGLAAVKARGNREEGEPITVKLTFAD